MASRFGWVDFAEQDRQKMLDVVRLFKEKETRDELGIGMIRDAFADYFFPGTTTIQTRARYMLFVPWIYQRLERKRVSSSRIAARARKEEVNLIYALLSSDDTDGVIGKEARNRLQRLPSSIYWSGLKGWGIRLFTGYQDEYHRYLDVFYERKRRTQSVGKEVDNELAYEAVGENWDPGLPEPPGAFPQEAELTLRLQDAQYLQERIRIRHEDRLLAYILTEEQYTNASFIWEHPVIHRVPSELLQDIRHAQNFSEAIYGVALLYNLMLARERDNEELIDEYQNRFDYWADLLATRWIELVNWHNNLPAFWTSSALRLTNIPYLTQSFVEKWLDLVFAHGNNLAGIVDDQATHTLIKRREIQLKKGRARLQNPRALERWPGHSGDYQLDFRWAITQRFAKDILKGLNSLEISHYA